MASDRQSILRAADEARRRGRLRKAIAGYERLLTDDPADGAVHGKLAPLLARDGRLDAALASFRQAAADHVRRGFIDKAIGIYQHAVRYVPREPSLWMSMADLHASRHRRADAVASLIEGARHLGSRRQRNECVVLLRRAIELEPWHLEATIALARTLSRKGERVQARELLEALAPNVGGRGLRAVRAAIFRCSPTPANLWRWLRVPQRPR